MIKSTQAKTREKHILNAAISKKTERAMQFLLDEYKSQQAVERGFRFLKSPDCLTSSLFLKKPERIEAVLMIMTCSPMVYAGLEHLIRQRLVEQNAFFPDMKKKTNSAPNRKMGIFLFSRNQCSNH